MNAKPSWGELAFFIFSVEEIGDFLTLLLVEDVGVLESSVGV